MWRRHRDSKCTEQPASLGLDEQGRGLALSKGAKLDEGSLGRETRLSGEVACLPGIS